jgi:hypothetical protein
MPSEPLPVGPTNSKELTMLYNEMNEHVSIFDNFMPHVYETFPTLATFSR